MSGHDAGVRIIAHRTCPLDAAENSIAGIRRAAELGADYVEVDVRRTRDGVPVLMHDPLLIRTAGSWLPVRLASSRVLGRSRLRGNGEPVPTFAAALAALPDRLGMAVDIKHASAAAPTLDEVERQGKQDRVLLWSQHMSAATYLADHAVGVEVALLRDTFNERATEEFLDDAARIGVHAVSVHEGVLTEGLVDEARERGLGVYSWVRNPDQHEEKMATGLLGLITDYPLEAQRLLG